MIIELCSVHIHIYFSIPTLTELVGYFGSYSSQETARNCKPKWESNIPPIRREFVIVTGYGAQHNYK